jgi:uncharacterized protein YjbI with pentapeptide repeats
MEQALLQEANLAQANFTGVKAIQALMVKTDCTKTNFSGADLTYADFSHADLTEANFSNTALFRANLHEVVEHNTVWKGANKSVSLGTDPKKQKAEQWKA